MLRPLSDEGFNRFSMARPQTARDIQKLWGGRLSLSLTHTNPQHTHTCISFESVAAVLFHNFIQLTSDTSAGFQICLAPFVYFPGFGVWKSFADSAARSDVVVGFCSCRLARKMYTLVISKQLTFYYKWCHICMQRGENTELVFERRRPLWGQILLNAMSHSRKSLSNRRPNEEKHFRNIFLLLLWYDGHFDSLSALLLTLFRLLLTSQCSHKDNISIQ